MGESSLQMWTDYPKTTTVDHFFALPIGSNFIDFNVEKEDGPVENAWVTIYMGDEILSQLHK